VIGTVICSWCRSTSAGPKAEAPWQANPATVFVDDDPNLVVERVDDRGLFVSVFASSSQPEVDDILLSTAGDGFLRRVIAVTKRPDGTVYVATEQAKLEEAFDELTVSGKGTLNLTTSTADKDTTEAKVLIDESWRYNKTFPITTGADVDASITLGPALNFDMGMKISGAKLQHAKVVVDGNLKAFLDLGVRIRKDLKVSGQARLTPSGIPVGMVWVGFIPVNISLDVYAGLNNLGGAQGTAGFKAEATGWLKAGVEFSNARWNTTSGASLPLNLIPRTSFESFGSGEVYLKVRVSTAMLGASGPYVDLTTPRLRLNPIRDSYGNRLLEITPGLLGTIRFDIPIIDMEVVNMKVLDLWFASKRIRF
jgi:hypothetical protein